MVNQKQWFPIPISKRLDELNLLVHDSTGRRLFYQFVAKRGFGEKVVVKGGRFSVLCPTDKAIELNFAFTFDVDSKQQSLWYEWSTDGISKLVEMFLAK